MCLRGRNYITNMKRKNHLNLFIFKSKCSLLQYTNTDLLNPVYTVFIKFYKNKKVTLANIIH